jgi:hypothetical protein
MWYDPAAASLLHHCCYAYCANSSCNFYLQVGMRLFLMAGMFQHKSLRARQVLPLAAAYVGYIVLCNLSLKVNTVGFYQVGACGVLQRCGSRVLHVAWYLLVIGAAHTVTGRVQLAGKRLCRECCQRLFGTS